MSNNVDKGRNVKLNREKIMFSVLKEIENGNAPNHNDYGIDQELYGQIIEVMLDDNLIKNATVQRGGIGANVVYIILNHTRITSDGLRFLAENNKWSKTYRGLKEIRDWIPGY